MINILNFGVREQLFSVFLSGLAFFLETGENFLFNYPRTDGLCIVLYACVHEFLN